MSSETDKEQWSKINATLERISEHEKECEKRYGEMNSRFSAIETKLTMLIWMVGTLFTAAATGGFAALFTYLFK